MGEFDLFEWLNKMNRLDMAQVGQKLANIACTDIAIKKSGLSQKKTA